MLKKGMPVVMMSALLLGACMNNTDNGALPRDDETPMENFEDRERNWTPNAGDERRGGPDIDGIDTNEDMNNGRDNRNTIQNDDPLNEIPEEGRTNQNR